MIGVARAFFTSAIIYGLLGMLLGLHMAIQQNHGQMPTHAHIMVVGWLSFSVFGLFYAQNYKSVPKLLASAHFWLAQLSLLGLAVGLYLIHAGKTEFEPVAAISATAYALSFLLFAVVALQAMRLPKD